MSYQKNKKLWVAVDCLVFGYDVDKEQINVLAFKRKVDPFANQWSLIGGFVEEDEHLLDAAKRVLNKFTGLDDVFLEQVKTYGKSNRDPAGRVISVLYCSLIKLDQIHKDIVLQHGAEWFPIHNTPNFVLDHNHMVNTGIQFLLDKAKSTPLGFELLPDKFTVPQLLHLYEAIYNEQLDDRNFRKKILSTELLVKLNEKDKSTSRKGAYLYQFNQHKYEELKSKGCHLELF